MGKEKTSPSTGKRSLAGKSRGWVTIKRGHWLVKVATVEAVKVTGESEGKAVAGKNVTSN